MPGRLGGRGGVGLFHNRVAHSPVNWMEIPRAPSSSNMETIHVTPAPLCPQARTEAGRAVKNVVWGLLIRSSYQKQLAGNEPSATEQSATLEALKARSFLLKEIFKNKTTIFKPQGPATSQESLPRKQGEPWRHRGPVAPPRPLGDQKLPRSTPGRAVEGEHLAPAP